MISAESFSREWISQRSTELDYKDKPLLEKVIRAFSLLEMLVEAGAPIIFKGGSSLLLILKDSLNRLSIDIDIICPPGTDIEQYWDRYARDYGFTFVEAVDRIYRSDVPKTHAKCHYPRPDDYAGGVHIFLLS